MTDEPPTDPIGDTTPETAHALLWRHGLPEDVIDGALALFAQELAGKIRAHRDHTRGAVQATKVMDFAADLISPECWARTEPTVPAAFAVLPPPADRAAVLLWAADQIAGMDPVEAALAGQYAWQEAARNLRRLAAEAQQQPEGDARP